MNTREAIGIALDEMAGRDIMAANVNDPSWISGTCGKYIPGEESIMLGIRNLESAKAYIEQTGTPDHYVKGMIEATISEMNAALARMRRAAQ